MQDEDGQTCDVHSVSAGLDYPGVGPEHSYWKDDRAGAVHSCRDGDALQAFDALASCEGILPALESSHAIAHAMRIGGRARPAPDRLWFVCPAAATRMRPRWLACGASGSSFEVPRGWPD